MKYLTKTRKMIFSKQENLSMLPFILFQNGFASIISGAKKTHTGTE